MGKAKIPIWYIKKIYHNTWYAEDGRRSEYISNSHCKCCALSELISKRGGNVDLRGLSRYGTCYQFLAVLVRSMRDEVPHA